MQAPATITPQMGKKSVK